MTYTPVYKKLFDAIAEDLKYCKHGESDFLEEFLKAPSVELLDFGKVELWSWEDVMSLGDADEIFTLFSNLQSLVVPSRWISLMDKLPDNDEVVDIYTSTDGRLTDCIYLRNYGGTIGNDFFSSVKSGPTCIRNATHWRRLPRNPQ